MELILAAAAGCCAALLATPAGVSGAVFLLPAQVFLLGAAPAVAAPTNLLFNVVTVPAALAGGRPYDRSDLAVVGPALIGAIPAIVLGVALRATGVVDGVVLRALVGLVLAAVGLWLLTPGIRTGLRRPPAAAVTGAAVLAGVLGGVYGIGGGALLAPALVAMGIVLRTAAVSVLVTTLVTSALGLLAQIALVVIAGAPGPDWALGLALGAGGLLGGYAGARIAPRVPRRVLRAVLGVTALAAAALSVASLS